VVKRAGEEPTSGCVISFFGDEDVDDLATLVDRPVQTDPPPGDFDLRFVNEPPITTAVPARLCRADQQRSEPLHPPVDADVIDVDAPLGQQFFDVSV
jgi:hypothetical protein